MFLLLLHIYSKEFARNSQPEFLHGEVWRERVSRPRSANRGVLARKWGAHLPLSPRSLSFLLPKLLPWFNHPRSSPSRSPTRKSHSTGTAAHALWMSEAGIDGHYSPFALEAGQISGAM